MGVKSVIDIDVNDESFKAFSRLFDKYQDALGKTPGKWSQVNQQVKTQQDGFQAVVTALVAQTKLLSDVLTANKRNAQEVRSQATVWTTISRTSRTVAGNVRDITGNLLKWSAITGTFAGILGVGSLFGIDRLAGSVSQGRRASTGLGSSYGQQKAFGVNYDRYVDSGSFLSAVNEALHDVTKRSPLYGAGLSDSDMTGSSADVSSRALASIKRILDRTPDQQIAQELSSRGLSQFMDLQSAIRLKGTSWEEFNKAQGAYRKDSSDLNISNPAQRGWQDLDVQLDRASKNISKVFGEGLQSLAPGISSLSESLTKSIGTLVNNGKFNGWIEGIGKGLESLASYIGTDDFQYKVRTLAEGIVWAGNKIGSGLKLLGFSPSSGPPAPVTEDRSKLITPAPAPGTWLGTERGGYAGSGSARGNNPGNMRMPGQSSGFATFASEEEGIKAIAKQMNIYQRRDGLDTISGIISKYAPPSENDTRNYVGNVSKWTGYGANDKLDLSNPEVMSKLIAAITRQEGNKRFSPDAVRVIIQNNTGGSAVINTSQLAAGAQ